MPFAWVEDDPYLVGVTSSTGIETTHEIPAAVETTAATGQSFLGYALIGLLVGIVPVALGLAWLPSLRRADERWLAAFMALTAGLLTFLAVRRARRGARAPGAHCRERSRAWASSDRRRAQLPRPDLGRQRLSRRGKRARGREPGVLGGVALATLVAIGIGLHNLGEGLAIGSSFALGELALGTFLIVGFMVHNITEGLGIATPAAASRISIGRLVALCLIAGAPAIIGAWIGGFLTNDVVGVLFFAIAVGAALQVVVEVGRYIRRRAPGGLTLGYAVGGFLAGVVRSCTRRGC